MHQGFDVEEDYDLQQPSWEEHPAFTVYENAEKFENLLDRRTIKSMQSKRSKNVVSSPSLLKRFGTYKSARSFSNLRNLNNKSEMHPVHQEQVENRLLASSSATGMLGSSVS